VNLREKEKQIEGEKKYVDEKRKEEKGKDFLTPHTLKTYIWHHT